MQIDKKDVLHLKKYDYRVLTRIYDSGTKQIMLDKDGLAKDEMALIASAGHAVDLVDAAQNNKKCKLDFKIDTQANIGNAVVRIFLTEIQEGRNERSIRNSIAKKVSSYLLFEMWNFFGDENTLDAEFDLSMEFDLVSGTNAINKQKIVLKSKTDKSTVFVFDALEIGKAFAQEDIHIVDKKEMGVGVDMNALFHRVMDALKQMES